MCYNFYVRKTHFSKQSTYAVSLYFDEFSSEAISQIVTALAKCTENYYLCENFVPPHLTLGMFHATNTNFLKLNKSFFDFSKSISQVFDISFSGADSFREKVIFLGVKDCELLRNLNLFLHKKFFDFEVGGNRNYLPEKFFPHVALAVKLNKYQFSKGISNLPFIKLPDSARIESLVFAKCHPYDEISRILFNSPNVEF